jgi:hypothetical protein
MPMPRYCGTRQALAETISQRSPRFSSINALNAGVGFDAPVLGLPVLITMLYAQAVPYMRSFLHCVL